MPPPTTPLSTFLLARIADRETSARNAGGGVWDTVQGDVSWIEEQRTGEIICQTQRFEWAWHIGWHSPHQVLLECASARRIIDVYLHTAHAMDKVSQDDEAQYVALRVAAEEGQLIAKLLALPYADHPDYLEEWRP